MKSVLKKFLPSLLIYYLRSFRLKLGLFFIAVSAKSRLLSSFYYLINRAFANEHFSVLRGRKAYHDSLKDIGESCALLRRNTHRLEKGLIMKPRREVFAQGFIGETVDCYKNAMQSRSLAASVTKWATDV